MRKSLIQHHRGQNTRDLSGKMIRTSRKPKVRKNLTCENRWRGTRRIDKIYLITTGLGRAVYTCSKTQWDSAGLTNAGGMGASQDPVNF